MDIILDKSWKSVLLDQFYDDYFIRLANLVDNDVKNGIVVYPPNNLIFNAFNLCSINDLKVVIIGQDPYINENEAMGLSFSVPNGVKCPPSLRNIFKEIELEYNCKMSGNTDLSLWARQGVLLLNSILTVKKGLSASHSKYGWETFTDYVIRYISDNYTGVVFMLWGNYAKSKKKLVDNNKHLVLESAHPSPLARGGFFNNNHFIIANKYLTDNGKKAINWIF